MRVLWLCSKPLSDEETRSTATWLDTMAHGLLDSGNVELGIIATAPVSQFERLDYRQVKQWRVPFNCRRGADGLPTAAILGRILDAGREFAPDLVHAWGTEGFWGLIPARGLMPGPALLEMQGLKAAIAPVFDGHLTWREQLGCVGFKEVVKFRSIAKSRRSFAEWGHREQEMIRGIADVSVQSPWMAAWIRSINPAAKVRPVDIVLRKPFYEAPAWCHQGPPILFTSAAYALPFKGLHVAVRAAALLKREWPSVRLRIAGAHQLKGVRADGYTTWVARLIRQYGLTEHVDWLGPLAAHQIVEELSHASVMIVPTFVENCCTSMQEAMAVGTPVVASYAGGIPSLAQDEQSCLFFPPGDEVMCASQVERILSDSDLATRLSANAREVAKVRNDRERIVRRQLEIYREIAGREALAARPAIGGVTP